MVPFLARVSVTPGEVVLLEASQVDQAVAEGRVRLGRDFIFFFLEVDGLWGWYGDLNL